jgi:hypothetical protein
MVEGYDPETELVICFIRAGACGRTEIDSYRIRPRPTPGARMTAPRTVKVGRRYQFRGAGLPYRVPFIRLSGQWIVEAGFGEGDMIEVKVSAGSILLSRREGAPMPLPEQPELF